LFQYFGVFLFILCMSNQDTCVCCCKRIQEKHKIISCKHCKLYTHKKCTKLKRKELINATINDWACPNCILLHANGVTKNDSCTFNDIYDKDLNETSETQIDLCDLNLQKYEKMAFNPVRFENICGWTENENEIEVHKVDELPKSTYVTPDEFNQQSTSESREYFSILNVNIRSINKNFEKLKECLKEIQNNFTIIGLSETHLQDAPADYFKIPGYDVEYTNRVNKQKGVCVCIFQTR